MRSATAVAAVCPAAPGWSATRRPALLTRGDVLPFVLRFVCGGLVVAAVPLVARRWGPFAGGIVVLVPVVTLVAFYFLGRSEGRTAVHSATTGALLALVPLAVFLIAIWVLSRTPGSTVMALLSALAVWIVAMAVVIAFSGTERWEVHGQPVLHDARR